MTYERAEQLLNPKTTSEALDGMGRAEAIKSIEEACEVAVECIEKQIPKKPTYKTTSYTENNTIKAECNCGKILYEVDISNDCAWGHKARYCEWCGQKLDWSDY